jgi:hypothetical protein
MGYLEKLKNDRLDLEQKKELDKGRKNLDL